MISAKFENQPNGLEHTQISQYIHVNIDIKQVK